MGTIITMLRFWLGSMFLYSSGLKLANYSRATKSVENYRILPREANTIVGISLPWLELLAGILTLKGHPRLVGPIITGILGASFTYASNHTLQRKAVIPCGCNGTGHDKVNSITLLRAITITLSSLLLLLAGQKSTEQLPKESLLAAAFLAAGSSAASKLQTVSRMREDKIRLHEKEQMTHAVRQLLSEAPSEPLPPKPAHNKT